MGSRQKRHQDKQQGFDGEAACAPDPFPHATDRHVRQRLVAQRLRELQPEGRALVLHEQRLVAEACDGGQDKPRAQKEMVKETSGLRNSAAWNDSRFHCSLGMGRFFCFASSRRAGSSFQCAVPWSRLVARLS